MKNKSLGLKKKRNYQNFCNNYTINSENNNYNSKNNTIIHFHESKKIKNFLEKNVSTKPKEKNTLSGISIISQNEKEEKEKEINFVEKINEDLNNSLKSLQPKEKDEIYFNEKLHSTSIKKENEEKNNNRNDNLKSQSNLNFLDSLNKTNTDKEMSNLIKKIIHNNNNSNLLISKNRLEQQFYLLKKLLDLTESKL